MFAAGMLLGSAITYGLCWWVWKSEQDSDRWWQVNAGRRDARWPVLGPVDQDGE